VAVLVVTGLLASAGVAGAAPADAGARRPQRRPVVRRARPLRRSPGVDVRRDDATVFLDVDAAWLAGPDDVTETATFSAYEEAGRVSATYRAKSRTVPAVSGGVRLWHGLWLGAAFAQSSSSAAAAVSVDVPHPFFFDQPRHAAVSRRRRGDGRRRSKSMHSGPSRSSAGSSCASSRDRRSSACGRMSCPIIRTPTPIRSR
jgi:hypothetical protein